VADLEVVTDPEIDDPTKWPYTGDAAWVSISGGSIELIGSEGTSIEGDSLPAVIGQTYTYTVEVPAYTAGLVALYYGSATPFLYLTGAETFTGSFVADSTASLRIGASFTATATFNRISILTPTQEQSAGGQNMSNKNFRTTDPIQVLTDAQRLALDTNDLTPGLCVLTSDTDVLYRWTGASWSMVGTGGSVHVRTSGSPGILEIASAVFNNAADAVAFGSIVAGSVIQLTDWAAGKQRCRITYNHEAGAIPFAAFVAVSLNDTSATAAAESMKITDVSLGASHSVNGTNNGGRLVSAANPVIEYNLEGTDGTIDDVWLAGIDPAGTGAGLVIVTVEVW